MAVRAEPATRRERFTVSETTFRRIADSALALLTIIVFTGAGVRLTGSGLGCPDWPQCHGTLTPELDSHIAIEYGNRLVSALVGVPCLLAAVLVRRVRPFRRDLVRPSLALFGGVAAQGILGGITVISDLKWQVVIAHYLLSMVLLAAGALLVWRVRRGPDAAPVVHDRRLVLAVRVLAGWAGAVIVLGTFVTAAGPHSGGAGTGDIVERMTAIPLTTMIYIHGHFATAMAVGAIALWFLARRRGASPVLRMFLTGTCLLIALQGAAGLAQYHLALPAELVWAHASLAAVLWVAFCMSVLAAGQPAAR